MKTILVLLFQLFLCSAFAQVEIFGVVFSQPGEPVPGANVFLQNTYEGSTTDSLGRFNFSTDKTGLQTLIVSFIGCETKVIEIDVPKTAQNLTVELKKETSELDEVVINAGTFEASDKKKSVILKPIDVALTAGANGDFYGAFGTLPGSHKVGEEGRLFVRGGESYETKTFMDGMLINTPYFSKMPDLPTRGRFSPLLFNGAVFSTGGYSAEYGQALSSIVALNTVALEPEDKSSISVMTVGVQGSHSERWEKSSLAVTGEYLHTGLNNQLFRQNIEWLQTPVIAGSTLLFRQKTSETGMVKSFGSFSHNASRMLHNNFAEKKFQDLSLNNNNIYFNTTYNEMLNENWMINSGLAGSIDHDYLLLDLNRIQTTTKSSQVKINLTTTSVKNMTVKFGCDFTNTSYNQEITMENDVLLDFSNNQWAGFAEAETRIIKTLAVRAGLRAEKSSLNKDPDFMPRLSAALKTGKNSQLSAAYGTFVQNPKDDFLKFNPGLKPEKSTHQILTWQYKNGTQTLRIEGYNKTYNNLVKFGEEFLPEPGNYTNNGKGYSRGIDVFWRKQQEFGKSDYWVSYSFNDSKRDYRNFSEMATPHYVSRHNLSVVYKKFFPGISSFVSATYSFASGRPYFNPNNPYFMQDRTKPYNDLSIGITHILYVLNKQTVLHLIVNNLPGFDNVFGYMYSNTKNEARNYAANPITPPSKRMAVFLISFQL